MPSSIEKLLSALHERDAIMIEFNNYMREHIFDYTLKQILDYIARYYALISETNDPDPRKDQVARDTPSAG